MFTMPLKSRLSFAACAGLLSLMAGPVGAMFIDVQFIGGVDIAGYRTWSFDEGSPLPNQEVERTVRATIESQMTAKGYSRVEGKADCLIAGGSVVTPRTQVPAGTLWRGNPARLARELSPDEIAYQAYSAVHYVRLKDRYLAQRSRADVGP